jgi:ABC-2 type transport system ATP-binding protein
MSTLRRIFAPRREVKVAVEGLDLAIEAGEAVAYVGPNGAGKSTTIKMLTGVLVPTGGHVHVNGLEPFRQRIANARRIGVVFGQRTQLWWDLTVADSLELQRRIYGVPASVFRENLQRFSTLLELDAFLHLTARKLSLGQRMRADLAMALLHDPAIVYLDEPTIGLDLTAKERIRAFLKELNRERGTTIMLTTHDLADIEEVCRRIVIIDRGRKVFDGLLCDMLDRYARTRSIRFQLGGPHGGISSAFARHPAVSLEVHSDRRITLRFDRLQYSAGALTQEVMKHAPVVDFHLDEPSIEDVIRQLYAGKLVASEQT